MIDPLVLSDRTLELDLVETSPVAMPTEQLVALFGPTVIPSRPTAGLQSLDRWSLIGDTGAAAAAPTEMERS